MQRRERPISDMQKQTTSRPQKCLPGGLLPTMLCSIFIISLFTFGFNTYYPQFTFPNMMTCNSSSQSHPVALPSSLKSQLSHLQAELGILLHQLHTQTPESNSVSKFSDQLVSIAVSLDKFAESLSGLYSDAPGGSDQNQMSNVEEDLSEPEEDEAEQGMAGKTAFRSGELHNYTTPKPNRQMAKKNFLGVEALNPSIGLACAHMSSIVDRYMSYKLYGMCPEDQAVAQKLIANGCDPLPRRRCFSRTPPRYNKPLAMNTSLWTQPSDVNILWNQYKCKDYNCLVSGQTMDRRGFYKCSDCFNLTKRGWDVPTDESVSAEFTVDEVLALKP